MTPAGTPGPEWLRPGVFAPADGVVAGFSTRRGGVSDPPYDALNLGLSTHDRAENVHENRRRLFEAAGFGVDRLAVAGQVHGRVVRVVEAPGLYRGCDGLATRTPGVLLCLTAADCASVLLADAGRRVVAACHAGWRGAVAGIVGETLRVMVELGAVREAIRAYVSPCISLAHFEVGPEVAGQFDPAFVHRRPEWPRPHVDLKAALAAQLTAGGVPGGAVDVAPACTVAGTDRFFSHRAEHGRTGRMMGFIGLHEIRPG